MAEHRSPSTSVQHVLAAALAVLAVTAAAVAVRAPAAPASPDPAFGQGDGLTLLDTSVREAVDAVLPLADGRTLVVGTDIEGSAVYVARLQADGTPDPSFGSGGGGARFIPFGYPATAAGAALDPDGRILIAGTAGFTATDFIVARLTSDGVLDPSFGSGGQVRLDTGDIDQAYGLALQPDGAVLVAGRGGDGGRSAVVARVTAAGAPDPSFGQDGMVTTTFGTESAELYRVGLQPGGSVVVGGLTAGGDRVRPLVARLTAGGAPDTGYGDGGRVDPGSLPLTHVQDLAIDAAGRTVVVGRSGPEETVRSVVSRITTAGAVDAAFGTEGATTIEVSVRTVLNALAVDGSGRLLVSGLANPTRHLPAGKAFAVVARLTSSGLLDPTFGCGGTARFDIPAEGGGSASSVAVAPGGEILLGGLAFLDDDIDIPRSDSLIVRLRAEPAAGAGLVLAREDGGVSPLGDAPACGSLSGTALNRPVVAAARTVAGGGYWLGTSDGGVFSFGDAVFAGSTGDLMLNRPVVGMAADPDGGGYWLVAEDGGVFAFDAPFFGSTGDLVLNAPIVRMAPTATGSGYWLVAADGGVFSFGDAVFAGSTGDLVLNRPVVGMAADPDGSGYWLVAEDGGIFAFDAPFSGSTGDMTLNEEIVAMVAGPNRGGNGAGYWLVAEDGGIFAFDAPFPGAPTTPSFAARTVAAA